MSDPDRIREREHWQAIAEQLGLAPESEQPAVSEARPQQAPVKAEEDRPAGPPARRVEPAQPREQEPPPRRGRRGPSARADKKSTQRAVSQPPTTGESGGQEEPAASAQEGPNPRRGRRRRSGRALAATESEASDSRTGAETSNEGKATGKAAERPTPRARGRDRQKKGAPVKASQLTVTDEKTGDTVAAPEETEEAELEDVRSLSNWNVPSWNELIASLYRPER